jgi:hypothetical protein
MTKKQKSKKNSFIFRWLKHPGFLLTYTALMGAIVYSYSKTAFLYIKTSSNSISTDFWLKFVFYFLIFLFSIGIALLYDKFAGSSRWVKHQFGYQKKNIDFKHSVALLKSGSFQFYFSILLSIGFSWWMFDKINNNFHSWYRHYGQYMTRLRSPDVSHRVKALEHLAAYHTPEIKKLLKSKISNGTTKEKLVAIWMTGKTDYNDQEILETLEEASTSTNFDVKKAALLAIARIVANPKISTLRDIETVLKKYLSEKKPPPKSLLFAASFLRTPEFLNIFMDLYDINDIETSVILTYSIVWIKGATPLQEKRILSRLTKNIKSKSPRLKCIGTIGLAFKAQSIDDSIMILLRREFEAKSSKFKCSPEIFSLHPSNPKKDTINITRISIGKQKYPAFGKIRYRERVLRVLALNRDDSMMPWFNRMAKNKHIPIYLRDLSRLAGTKQKNDRRVVDW